MRLVPGDIVDEIVMAAMESTDIADVDEEALRAHFGLDVSAIVQFGRFWGVVPQGDGEYAGLLQGNLGVSWRARLPVREMIAIKLPVTFELGIVSFILAQLIAIPMGVLSALRQNTLADYFVRSFAILAISIPSFWFATVVVVFGGLWFGYLPPIRWIPFSITRLRIWE